ncbi:phage tail tape measure protein, partial [Escherichia coli]|nr:phage tail tape measure protein [Escherichia coli]
GSLSLVIGVLHGKLATLRLGFSLLTGSMNVVRVLPALWGMVTGSISLLGGAIGALLSPVGLIVAAFVAAAVLIWKYWEPIKAFYAGVFSGIMERLAPLRETFERFGPVFDVVRDGIIQVFNWFKSLLSPMESSKETLDKCTSAGEIFGNVLGGALQLVLTPAKMLLDTLAWILEKLGVLPDEAERARKKIEDAQRAAILQDKV